MSEDIDVHNAGIVPAVGTPWVPLDFDALEAASEYVAEGYRLLDENAGGKACLEDVPFAIVGIHYRPGIPKDGQEANFLSIECVVGSETKLRKLEAAGVFRVDALRVRPNECVVFNDGSTGVARQLTSFLHSTGRINVGPFDPRAGVGGKMGESPFDRHASVWTFGAEDATTTGIKGRPLLMCPRGLRVSQYAVESLNGKEAETYYIA